MGTKIFSSHIYISIYNLQSQQTYSLFATIFSIEIVCLFAYLFVCWLDKVMMRHQMVNYLLLLLLF